MAITFKFHPVDREEAKERPDFFPFKENNPKVAHIT
jgi:hypothetical protein